MLVNHAPHCNRISEILIKIFIKNSIKPKKVGVLQNPDDF